MTATPTWGPPAPQPPKPKPFYKRTWFIVTAAVVSLGLLGLILLGALIGAIGEGIEEAASPAQQSIEQPAAAPSTVDVAPTEDYDTPAVADFKLRVIETGREHFGSIGDNVEYRLELVDVGGKRLDPDKEYELKYRVTGSEDGPMTDTLIIRGDSYEEPFENIASTKRNVKLSAKVLSITEV
jgi:hypothetical protein